MGISQLDNDLIINKGIRGWGYEGGVCEAYKITGDYGWWIESDQDGSLMNFGNIGAYKATAYYVPIINVDEPYQGETKIYFKKQANTDYGELVACDDQGNEITTFGQVGLADGAIQRFCSLDSDIDDTPVTLGICSWYNGTDYTVMPSLVCPIITSETPYGNYGFLYCNGNFTAWFDNALQFWTDGDYYDPEEEFDPESEGGAEGTPGGGASGGGGGIGIRSHHGVGVPSVPAFSGATTGMMSVYACTPAQLQGIANKLWFKDATGDWTNSIVQNYLSPFENIIGMSLLPFEPTMYIAGSNTNVKIGNFDTEVTATKLSNTFAQIDLGTVSCPEAYRTYADYEYTKTEIFLPFIGMQTLNNDDVMDCTLHCVYNVDILSGVCVAFLESSKTGVFATFAGNCKADLPLSGASYSSQSVAWASNNFGSGGVAGRLAKHILVDRAKANDENTSIFDIGTKFMQGYYKVIGEDTEQPQYSRSGSVGSAGALLGIKQPFLIFSTPKVWSSGVKANKGYVSNLYVRIGDESGFISSTVSNNQLNNISCTDQEKEEIKKLLSEGIYI